MTKAIQKLNILKGNISFEKVCFSYKKDEPVLDISFNIRKGQMLALVGKTGAGKTSIKYSQQILKLMLDLVKLMI